jgi:hypothetical protein
MKMVGEVLLETKYICKIVENKKETIITGPNGNTVVVEGE